MSGTAVARLNLGETGFFPGLRSPKESFRDIRNYLAGQAVGATRDDALLDEVLKCLFCKLYAETSEGGAIPLGLDFREKTSLAQAIFRKVRSDFPDIYGPKDEILLDSRSISLVLDQCDFSLIDANSDPIGDAFEIFVGSESRSRAGQFFTPKTVTDFLVEAVAPEAGETVVDPACGAGGFLTSVARRYMRQGVSVNELARRASESLFGIDKDAYLLKLAKLHISLVTKGHPNLVCGDSLSLQSNQNTLNLSIPREGFDVVLTNPPFGARIVAALPDTLRSYALARKWKHDSTSGTWVVTNVIQNQVPPQVLFIERCLSFLKTGGRLGIVLPESVLSNKSYRYVVEYVTQHCDVHAVIGMPESLFKTSGKGGTHTKTCLLLATKAKERKSSRIFMAEAKWCGHDSRARTIPNNDLPAIAENLSRYQANKTFAASHLGFVLKKRELRSNVLCPRYYDPQIALQLEGLATTHSLMTFGELVERGLLTVTTGDELGKLAYGTGTVPFIRTSDLSNWELKADHKHGVDKKLYNSLKRKQDVQAGDILMVKDGTYLIGICALISEADTEIVYQSHIFKIRVQPNDLGLNSFLLLAILSSPVVQRQIKAKQFTQDIIDSLGERINELVLPIPKSPQMRERITSMVKRSVKLRIEARELARDARASVHRSCELD